MGHLTEPELSGYRQRTLEPESLLRVTEHLAACEDCRTTLRGLLGTGESLRELRRLFQSHLTAEQLQQFVDAELDSGMRATVEQHLGVCAECAKDAQALREFANGTLPGFGTAQPARRRWWAAVAAAVVIALGVGVWLQRRPAVIAVLNDAGVPITLDSRNQLKGISGLLPQQAESVRRILRGEDLEPAVNLSELRPQNGALMGSPEPVSFHLVGPIGTAVRTATPELHWTARGPGATYVVTLKNLSSGLTISSPSLRFLAWMPADPLQPGLYAWQVAASLEGSEEVAPSPPSPQARFLVLDAGTVARLNNLPPSHLVRAVLYAESGLLDSAEQEAGALQDQNPGSAVAHGLLQRIQALRVTTPQR